MMDNDPDTTVAVATGAPHYTMFFDQSAHLDWDWLWTFAQNYWFYKDDQGADSIIRRGIEAARDQEKNSGYSYTVCEMSFLRRFMEVNPKYICTARDMAQIANGERFQIVGGGMTSPDCLVCSSEGFIRNYLTGQVWARQVLGVEPKPYCWIPDDFGQSPELPVLLSALGFEAVLIARLPGRHEDTPTSGLGQDLRQNGLDFVWEAANGSTIVLHWTGGVYNKSDNLQGSKSEAEHLEQIKYLIGLYTSSQQPASGVSVYSGAKSSCMYWPIMDDFSTIETPIQGLAQHFKTWNDNLYQDQTYSAKNTNVRVEWGTFHKYYTELAKSKTNLETKPYNGAPLWEGFFASRPKLKALHYDTVRALVAAEVIGLLTQPYNTEVKSLLPTDFWPRIDQIWTDFSPSTHHDFITGTAPDGVYAAEQLPILQGTAAAAAALRAAALSALGGSVSDTSADRPGIIVANSLGFTRTGLVHVENVECFASNLVWTAKEEDDALISRTQRMSDGTMMVFVPEIKSFGYTLGRVPLPWELTDDNLKTLPDVKEKVMLTMTEATEPNGCSGPVIPVSTLCDVYSHERSAASFTLKNKWLEVSIRADRDWGIDSIKDITGQTNILSNGIGGNDIVFYDESSYGDIYQFGHEKSLKEDANQLYKLVKRSPKVIKVGPGLGAFVVEVGELVAVVRTVVLYKFNEDEIHDSEAPTAACVYRRFTRDYELRAGEKFLRMTTTGSAPPETAVMTTFPFGHNIDGIDHGTGFHWTDQQPYLGVPPGAPPRNPPVFRPTQDFLMPYRIRYDDNKEALAMIYHEAMPAWAIDCAEYDATKNGKVLMGCLYRNSSMRASGAGAVGSDPTVHTHRYAIGSVAAIQAQPEPGQPPRPGRLPDLGQRYCEAQKFHTPLLAIRLPRGPDGDKEYFKGHLNDNSGSLAEVSSDETTVVLTVAKPGSYDASKLILRLYQPDNELEETPVKIALPAKVESAELVTGLETPWKGKGSATINAEGTEITLNMSGCISTVAIGKLGRAA